MDDNVIPFQPNPDAITVKEFERLASEMLALKFKIEEMQKAVDRESEKLSELQEKILGAMNDLGKTEYIIEGMGKVAVDNKESVTVPKTIEDKKALFAWLEKRDMFYEFVNVNSQTLNRLYNEEMEAALQRGELEVKIDGIAPPKPYQKIRIVKARK